MITRRLFFLSSLLLLAPQLRASELRIAPADIAVLPGDWQLTPADVQKALKAIINHLDPPGVQKLRTRQDVDEVIHNRRGYRGQLQGQLAAGKKVIFGNFLPAIVPGQPDAFPEWKKTMVMVDGGGAGFWHITYDPAKGVCSDFAVNATE